MLKNIWKGGKGLDDLKTMAGNKLVPKINVGLETFDMIFCCCLFVCLLVCLFCFV